MKKIISILIRIYKKYGYLFQGKLFYAVILLYKYRRVTDTGKEAAGIVAKNMKSIHVYSSRSKSKAISRLLEKCAVRAEPGRFFYMIDEFSTLKMKGRIIGNCAIDYQRAVDHPFRDLKMTGDSRFEEENNRVLLSIRAYMLRAGKILARDHDMADSIAVKCMEKAWSEPAGSLEDALQRILLISQIQWQTGHILMGLGRLDKVLDRFSGDPRSDGELADILHEFCECLHRHYCLKSNALLGDTGQIIILGGLEPDGSYFYNRFTTLFIDAVSGLPDPKVLVRVSVKTPKPVWAKIMEYMSGCTGSPLISNDDVIIPRMREFGYSAKAAYGYTTSACWEPMPGDCYEQNNIVSINYLEPFEYISKLRKDICSFDMFLNVYFEGLKEHVSRILKQTDSIRWEKDPLLSMFSQNCRKVKRDVSEGGCSFNNYGLLTVGMANAVNSMLVLKKYVFKSKEYRYTELDRIRKHNFKGCEKLRKKMRDSSCFFGRDDQEVVSLVNKITLKTHEFVSGYRNRYGGKVKIGLSSPHYIMDSEDYPASFDGRRKGEPFAVHISSDDNSQLTQLFNFAAALDYTDGRFNGNVVDYIISPSVVNDNREKFLMLVQKGFEKGICQMQANVLSSSELKKAKENPEHFPNLIVRVWGFNAYFVQLPEEYQDYLIERAQRSERAG